MDTPEITKQDDVTIKETVTTTKETTYTLDQLYSQVEQIRRQIVSYENSLEDLEQQETDTLAKIATARALGVKTSLEIAAEAQVDVVAPSSPTDPEVVPN